jgi:hypothetical protein
MMEFAVQSIPQVTGINYEFMGQKDINQPGVLENMRKMAAMTILATMFDSLRRFRKIIGRLRLFVIQNFISDGRLIRITNQPQGVALMKDATAGEYDVVVDDAPTSPNQKDRNWATVLMEVLKYSPLPDQLVQAITKVMAQPNPEAEEAKQIAKATAIAKLNQFQSAAELNNSKSGATQATAIYDIAMADNLLKKNDNEAGLKELADAAHKAAQIGTEQAKADKLRAEIPKTRAEMHSTLADAVHTHVQANTLARTPIENPNAPPAKSAPAPSRSNGGGSGRDDVLHAHLEALSRHAASQTAAMQALVKHATTPKRRVPQRDAAGRITHVDEVPVH